MENKFTFAIEFLIPHLEEKEKQKQKVEKYFDEEGNSISLLDYVLTLPEGEIKTKLIGSLQLTTGFLRENAILKTQKFGLDLKKECQKLKIESEYNQARHLVSSAKERKEIFYEEKKIESFIALSLYTSNAIYSHLNSIWRGEKHDNLDTRYTFIAGKMIEGFRSLPSYLGTSYRGAVLKIDCFEVGKIILFKAFTSSSLDQQKAREFLRKKDLGEDAKNKRVLFIIQGKSGRNITSMSFFPNEKEILFRGHTSFKVTQIIIPPTPEHIYEIHLNEEYEDLRGNKVILWVDDNLGENKSLKDLCEKENITFVTKISTKDAIDFLKEKPSLMKRSFDQFRIVTDMVRNELQNNGKMECKIEAGLDFIKYIKENFPDYSSPILIYLGQQYEEANTKKVKEANLRNILITSLQNVAKDFVTFKKNE